MKITADDLNGFNVAELIGMFPEQQQELIMGFIKMINVRDKRIIELENPVPEKVELITIPGMHDLKCWPKYFEEIRIGIRAFELRKNDRGFKNGEFLLLREYSPETKAYSKRTMVRQVDYLLDVAHFGLQEGFVILQLKKIRFKCKESHCKEEAVMDWNGCGCWICRNHADIYDNRFEDDYR